MTHASFKSKRKKASQEFWDLLKTESHWFGVSHVILPEPITMSREIGRLATLVSILQWSWGGGGASPPNPHGLTVAEG